MDWMTGFSFRAGLVDEYTATTDAVLGGRDGFGAFPDDGGIYGDAWQGGRCSSSHAIPTTRRTPPR